MKYVIPILLVINISVTSYCVYYLASHDGVTVSAIRTMGTQCKEYTFEKQRHQQKHNVKVCK